MFRYGEKSLEHIRKLHKDLQLILGEAIKYVDITVIDSHRDEDTQNKYFKEGKSKVKFPNSKHNKFPSMAVDIIPLKFPNNFKDWAKFAYMIGIIKGISEEMYKNGTIKHRLRFGLDFNRDGILFNDSFVDAPHIELED